MPEIYESLPSRWAIKISEAKSMTSFLRIGDDEFSTCDSDDKFSLLSAERPAQSGATHTEVEGVSSTDLIKKGFLQFA